MKLWFIILCYFAFLGFLTAGNLLHEGEHYFHLKSHPNVTINAFCAVAVPIPEQNYDRVGYVSFNYSGTDHEEFNQFLKTDELYARLFDRGISISILILFLYLFWKDQQKEPVLS